MLGQSSILSNLVPYRVAKKGTNDQRRYEKFFKYRQLDQASEDLLNNNLSGWSDDPGSFWEHELPVSDGTQTNILAHVIGSYRCAESNGA